MDMNDHAQILAQQLKVGRDPREKKPFILLNRDDYTKYLSLSSSWILTLGRYQIHLSQPNDIALYAHTTDFALKQAKEFYEENPGWYMARQSGGTIPVIADTELLYFDYFESIMRAVIFSFTSLETFANICLPDGYVYKDVKGKSIAKETIERRMSLDYKLEFILTDILQTPDPKQEVWWAPYLQLKDIRDQIIHSKPSKAEERYGILIRPDIFNVVGCYRQILTYYGVFIDANYQLLLDEFPYGFGFDGVCPKTISNEDYEEAIQARFNPWRPKQ